MTKIPELAGTQRYWLISSPRTASSMLVKILNLDNQGVRPASHGGYFFLPTIPKRYSLQSKPMTEWTEEERRSIDELEQQCFDRLQDYVERANEEKQLIYVKEHALLLNHPWFESESIHGKGSTVGEPTPLVPRDGGAGTRSAHNKTCLPDEYLKMWKPTFLIRHPAMTLPSLFRMTRREGFNRLNNEPNVIESTMYWARSLYNFYEAQSTEGSSWPLVLDADDLMQHPQLITKYASLVELDPGKLRFTWDKVPQEELDKMTPMQRGAQSSLNASDKVDLGKVAGKVDIAEEAIAWRSEFGEESGAKLERLVRDCMADYEYMHSKRLTLDN